MKTTTTPAEVKKSREILRQMAEAYHDMKVDALKDLLAEMRQTKDGYTCTDMANMSGLSLQEVSAQASCSCQASLEAGFSHGVYRRDEEETRHYVEVKDGVINPESTLTLHRMRAKYYAR